MQANELKSLADAPGTAREYETIYILRPTLTNDGVAEINERVRKIIEGMGGKVIKVDNWGKRRLAYEVAKERKGIYLYWQYLAVHGIVEELERNLRMLDASIRYMTIKLDADIDPNARPTEVDEETYERASNTAADEEDMYLTRGEGEDEDDDDGDGEKAAAAGDGETAAAEGEGGTAVAASEGEASEASEAGAADDEPAAADDEPAAADDEPAAADDADEQPAESTTEPAAAPEATEE